MKDLFHQYLINLYQDVPTEVYEGLISIFCLGTVGFFVIYGWKKGWKKVLGLLLTEYVFLICCSTVICRKVAEGVFGYNFSPFWSYEAIKNGREDVIAENIMNVVAFVPVGILLGLVTQKKQNNFRTRLARILLIVGAGLIISGSIEMLQFFLERGFSEFDDMFHNTLGCLIGFMIVTIIKGLWSLRKSY
jgi:glycopeptide antibiotics resistance protein